MAPGSCCCVARVIFIIVCIVFFILGALSGTKIFSSWNQSVVAKLPKKIQSFVHNSVITNVSPAASDCHRLQLLFLVMSTPDDKGIRRRALARKAIYKDYSNQRITVKFVMGTKYIGTEALIKQLESEQREFQDLVLLADHVDTYYKLPSKVISSIQWAVENEQFDYLVKTDHDVIVFFDNIKKFIKRFGCPKNLYCGHCYSDKDVEYTGKWNELNWVTCNKYLPYCAGRPGYVLGSKLVHSLAKYGHFLARDFKSEDAAMGLWLAPFRFQLQHDPLFSIRPSCEMNSYTIHQRRRFKVVANKLIKSGKLCSWSEKLQRMWFL